MKVDLRADRMTGNLTKMIVEMLVGLARDCSAGLMVDLRSTHSFNLGCFEGWLEG